jgi:hypothetical protein
MKVRLRGLVVRVVQKLLRGELGTYCDNVITLHRRLRGQQHLEVSLHEALHHCLPDFDESVVDDIALDLSVMLWKMGYRKVDNA